MEQRPCVFVPDKNASTFHPLHLRSDTVKWLSAFDRCDTPCIVSLCPIEHSYHSSETKLFTVLHLGNYPTKAFYSEGNGEDEDNEKIVLISTLAFHNHYGIASDATFLVVGPTLVFPLSRVVLGARTETTFEWANTKDFETGLMINSTCHKHLLVRQGDQFLASRSGNFGQDHFVISEHFRNLTALQTYPLQQGMMNTNTELIIVKMDSGNVEIDEPVGILNGKSVLDEIMQLEFVCRELLNEISFHSNSFDPQMDVLMSEDTADALELKDCDLLKLEMIISDICSEKSCREVICRMRVAKFRNDTLSLAINKTSVTLEEFTLYLAPVLWFNASSACKSQDIGDYEVKVERLDNIEYPPFASEVHLSLVLSPSYSPDGNFDEILIKHMSRERIMKKGDVIVIPVEEYPDFSATCEAKDMSCRSLYYKVASFSEKDDNSQHIYFRVDLKYASLYQVGTTNSFLPQSIPSKCEIPSGLSEVVHNLKDILRPYITMQIMDYTPTFLISGQPNCGKWSVISSVCRFYNLNVIKIGCYEFMSDNSGATEAKITAALERAALYAPCAVVLNCIERIGHNRETDQTDHRVCLGFKKALQNLLPDKYPVVVIATTWNLAEVAPDIRMEFIHKIEMRSPSEKQRRAMLDQILGFMMSGSDVKTDLLARQTVRFVFGDLCELCRKAAVAAKERIVKECAVGSKVSWIDEMAICAAGFAVQQCDFEFALKEMQSQLADTLGVPKIPEVSWNDVGGLENVKQHIKDTIQLPLEHPELFSSGLRRSGVLLYGPPGTGKTLLAKAVATQCSLSFLSVKGPELINMYVGQSEENVRNIFSKARDAAPCVIFFDELDSLAPNRGRSGDSGGVMDRVVSQLLAELDGMHGNDREKQIFVIGASNRPDLIDPALLRPGRFDKLLYVGINANKADQLKILEAQTRNMNLAPGVNLAAVVMMCPNNLTGADFFALTSAAAMNSIRRRIRDAETGLEINSDRESEALTVEQNDFEEAVKSLVPSVSVDELRNYESIKQQLL